MQSTKPNSTVNKMGEALYSGGKPEAGDQISFCDKSHGQGKSRVGNEKTGDYGRMVKRLVKM